MTTPEYYVYAIWRWGTVIKIGKGRANRCSQMKYEKAGDRGDIIERFDNEAHAYCRERWWLDGFDMDDQGRRYFYGRWHGPKPDDAEAAMSEWTGIPGQPTEHTQEYLDLLQTGLPEPDYGWNRDKGDLVVVAVEVPKTDVKALEVFAEKLRKIQEKSDAS